MSEHIERSRVPSNAIQIWPPEPPPSGKVCFKVSFTHRRTQQPQGEVLKAFINYLTKLDQVALVLLQTPHLLHGQPAEAPPIEVIVVAMSLEEFNDWLRAFELRLGKHTTGVYRITYVYNVQLGLAVDQLFEP